MSEDRSFHLDFERPIVELEKRIEELQNQAETDGLDLSKELHTLEERVEKLRQEVYSKLTRWQRVQISRHPQRPYALDYIERILTDFTELHGDRYYGDDRSIVGGPARLDGEPLMVVGIQSGRNVEERKERNFGMPHPEGYRKAMRLMNLAAKFHRPVLTLVDTSDTTLVVLSDHGFRAGQQAPVLESRHRDVGFIGVWGARARPGGSEPSAGLLDVTPTVCGLLGLDAGRDMPGRALTGLFVVESPDRGRSWVTDRPVSAPRPAPAALEEQLEVLGYRE